MMSPERPHRYRVKAAREIRGELFASPGDVVYLCLMHDYGSANDDHRLTGLAHLSVTKDANGGYPFFTIPAADLEYLPDA